MNKFDQLAGLTEAAAYLSWHAKLSKHPMAGKFKVASGAMGKADLAFDRVASAIGDYNKGAGPGTPAEIKRRWKYLADALDGVGVAVGKAKREALSWMKATKAESVGQFDQMTGLTEDAEQLDEMMHYGGGSRRYVNKRDLQYSLEDTSVACQRQRADMARFKHGGPEVPEKLHTALLKALKTSAAAAKACADAEDKAHA